MDMPKQMGAGSGGEQRQQQGEGTAPRRETQQQLAQTPAEQMRPAHFSAVHFSDWASI